MVQIDPSKNCLSEFSSTGCPNLHLSVGPSVRMSKCHIVGNHMSRLIYCMEIMHSLKYIFRLGKMWLFFGNINSKDTIKMQQSGS